MFFTRIVFRRTNPQQLRESRSCAARRSEIDAGGASPGKGTLRSATLQFPRPDAQPVCCALARCCARRTRFARQRKHSGTMNQISHCTWGGVIIPGVTTRFYRITVPPEHGLAADVRWSRSAIVRLLSVLAVVARTSRRWEEPYPIVSFPVRANPVVNL